MIRLFLLGIFNLFDHGIVSIIVIDPNVYPVVHLMPDDGFSQRGFDADQPIQGTAPDGRHQPVDFRLVILLDIELYRIVDRIALQFIPCQTLNRTGFTFYSHIISTHLLTVLIICAIVLIEQR